MKTFNLLLLGVCLLGSGCGGDIAWTDLERSRRITQLEIPASAKIDLRDGPQLGLRSPGETHIVIVLTPEDYERLAKDALSKDYVKFDSTDTMSRKFIGEDLGPDGMKTRPLGPEETGGSGIKSVILDKKTHRILVRYADA